MVELSKGETVRGGAVVSETKDQVLLLMIIIIIFIIVFVIA